VGYNVVNSADRRFLTGDIAHLRFDNAALTQAELAADAANFLGTLEVPEPSTGMLALAGLAAGTMRRRRR
jgi:MYXO-CTERM domain-containing protein